MICPVDCVLLLHLVQGKWWDMHHAWGRREMHTKFLLWNIQEGDSFQYIVMTRKVMLNCLWREQGMWCCLESFGWVHGPALGFCEHDNEPLVFKKAEKVILDSGEMRCILLILISSSALFYKTCHSFLAV